MIRVVIPLLLAMSITLFAQAGQNIPQFHPFKVALPPPGQMSHTTVKPNIYSDYAFFCKLNGVFINAGSIIVMVGAQEKQFNRSNEFEAILFNPILVHAGQAVNVSVISTSTLKYSAGKNPWVHCDYFIH